MRIPLFHEYLEYVIRPAVAACLRTDPNITMRDLHEMFCQEYDRISYTTFTKWMRMMGFTTTRATRISHPTLSVTPPPAASQIPTAFPPRPFTGLVGDDDGFDNETQADRAIIKSAANAERTTA